MNPGKNFIHDIEIPLMYQRMQDQKRYCTVLTVKPFSLNPKEHGTICQIPHYKKRAVLPPGSNVHDSEKFMDVFFIEEVLKKL
jgi:hypothetical protein